MIKKVPVKKKNSKNFFSKKGIIFFLIALVLGFAIGYFTTHTFRSKPKAQNFSEARTGGYQFINPLLDCDNYQTSDNIKLATLKKDLSDYVQEAYTDGKINHISVYYRDLNNGPWIGISQDENYTPASLLKVPLMIGLLKKAQTDKNLLKTKLTYSSHLDSNFVQNLGYKKNLKIGQAYTIMQLIELMIIESDNDAKEMLGQFIGFESISKTMEEMGVNLTNKDFANDFLSVKEYSSFFRILYNASYLDREMSEKALELLSRVKFNDGIPARLPKNIIIAHKFGERGYVNSQFRQLHDCGIVYVPGKPYLICIMTKGEGFDNLIKVIADISEIVYTNINSD